MARNGGHPDRHDLRRNGSYLSLRVDQIVSDQKLVRFGVYHATRRSTPDTLGVNRERFTEVSIDREQLVFTSSRLMGGIVHHPQLARPRHHGADAAFVVPTLVMSAVLAVDARTLSGADKHR